MAIGVVSKEDLLEIQKLRNELEIAAEIAIEAEAKVKAANSRYNRNLRELALACEAPDGANLDFLTGKWITKEEMAQLQRQAQMQQAAQMQGSAQSAPAYPTAQPMLHSVPQKVKAKKHHKR